MELLQLRYFYTVGKTLNISHAARIHQIPQPAMSKMISNLESDIGIRLFDRTKNHLSLTPAGSAFLASVEGALTTLDAGIADLESRKGHVCGDLRLAALYHRSTTVHCIERFLKDYPGVNFSIFNDLSSGPFDLVIGDPGAKVSCDSSRPLLREEIRIALPLNHPLAARKRLSIHELRSEKFIIPSFNHQLFRVFAAAAKEAGFTPTVSITSNDLYCIQRYFMLGIGISLVPIYSWATLFDRIGVVIPLEAPLYRTVHMYWNMQDLRKPSLALFKQYAEEEFRRLEEGLS